MDIAPLGQSGTGADGPHPRFTALLRRPPLGDRHPRQGEPEGAASSAPTRSRCWRTCCRRRGCRRPPATKLEVRTSNSSPACPMLVLQVHGPREARVARGVPRGDHPERASQPPGAGRRPFDVLQLEDDPLRFQLFEVYRTREATAAHKETAHYKAWLEAVTPMMAEARTRSWWTTVDPERPSTPMSFDFATAARILFGPAPRGRSPRWWRSWARGPWSSPGRPRPATSAIVDSPGGGRPAAAHVTIASEPGVDDVREARAEAAEAGCDVVAGGGRRQRDRRRQGGGRAAGQRRATRWTTWRWWGREALSTRRGPSWRYRRPRAAGRRSRERGAGLGDARREGQSAEPVHAPRVAVVDPGADGGAAAGADRGDGPRRPRAADRALPFAPREPVDRRVLRRGDAAGRAALRRAHADGHDAGAREPMSLASLLGGLALANAGLGAVHGFAGPLGRPLRGAARRGLRGAAARGPSRQPRGAAPGGPRARPPARRERRPPADREPAGSRGGRHLVAGGAARGPPDPAPLSLRPHPRRLSLRGDAGPRVEQHARQPGRFSTRRS